MNPNDTNTRPPQFTQEEAQAMYDFIRKVAGHNGNKFITRFLAKDARTLLAELDSAQAALSPAKGVEGAAETGERRQYFIRRYQKYVSSIFYEASDGKIIWVEDPDTYENAKKRVRELNVQAAVNRISSANAQAAAPSLLRPLSGDEDGGAK